MNKNVRKKFIFVIFFAVLLLIFGVAVIYIDHQLTLSNQRDQKVTLEGVVACLPHKKRGGVETLECAIGMKADNGKYYALADNTVPDINDRIKVEGTLISTPADDNSQYDVAGVIEKTKITVLK